MTKERLKVFNYAATFTNISVEMNSHGDAYRMLKFSGNYAEDKLQNISQASLELVRYAKQFNPKADEKILLQMAVFQVHNWIDSYYE